ncbi:hypothetical protein BOX15_Mlig011947g2, partial [Macrostomum lignano]
PAAAARTPEASQAMTSAPQATKRTFFTSIDWAALSSAGSDGCDIRVAGLCALGEAVSEFFDQLGVSFKPARNDVAGNVRKMTDAAKQLDSAPAAGAEEFQTGSVGHLLQSEQASGLAAKDPSGTIGLLWFKRALEYLYALLCLVHSSRARTGDFGMAELCRRAYEATLKPRHSWLVQKTFGLVISTSPKRSQFLARVTYGDDSVNEDELYESMAASLVAMRRLLECLNAALCRYNVESPPVPDLAALSPAGTESPAGAVEQ